MTRGQEFRLKREQLGLSQTELARKMGMLPQAINRIENGERDPTNIHMAFIDALCECYKRSNGYADVNE